MSEGQNEAPSNILAFSDWRTQPIDDLHTILQHLERDIDVILYAGDDVGRFVDTAKNQFHKLAQSADADLGYVLGNDDSPYALRHFQLETDRVHDLHRNPLQKADTLFIGQEGDVGSPSMGFIQYSEAEAESHLSDLYNSEDARDTILVSHTPPHGALDYAQRHSRERIGSEAVARFAEEIQPECVLSGHVHQFGGQTVERDFGPVINIASHDHDTAEGRIAFIEIPPDGDGDIEITQTTLTELALQLDGVTGELHAAAELRKLSQVGGSRVETSQENGIQTIDQIVVEGKDVLMTDCGLPEYHASIIYNHAKAYAEDDLRIIDRQEYQDVQDQQPILVDVETNLAQDTVWCIGAYDYKNDRFEQFVDLDDEESLITDFHQFLRQTECSDIAYYAGNGFDKNRLMEAGKRHSCDLAEHIGGWIDVCLIARETIFQPKEAHTLDSIARGLGYEFDHPDITGMAVGAAYSAYLADGEPPADGWKTYLEYNLDDTLAIKHIIDVLADADLTAPAASPVTKAAYTIAEGWNDLSGGIDATETQETESRCDGDSDQSELSETVSNILTSVPSKQRWTDENPVNKSADPHPTCDSCGEPLPSEEGREQLEVSVGNGDNVKRAIICSDGCSLNRELESHNEDTRGQDESRETHRGGSLRDFLSNDSKSNDRGKESKVMLECHDCGSKGSQADATQKYRINDGTTVPYCLDCQ